jgi:uncharacterized protein
MVKNFDNKYFVISFDKNYIAMKNVIGQPARGNDFYARDREVQKIISSLSNGNNIQITAPRRVGKTSILWYLLDNDVANRHYVYVDTESISEEQEFYKKLLREILRNDKIGSSTKIVKGFSDSGNQFFKKIKSVKIFNSSVDFNHEETERNYFDELTNFLAGYAAEESTELVLLVDEFPQTIENIKKSGEQNARIFLQRNRSLRLNPELNGKVKFIYTGSIGLNNTVSKLDATASINDLNSIGVGPLTEEEAIDLFKQLLYANDRIANAESSKKLVEILQWFIPFHIQLIVQQIIQQTQKGNEITADTVADAVKNIIDLRNQNHFDHYYSRLKTQFKDKSFRYADDVLKTIAKKDVLTREELFDLSFKYDLSDDYRKVVEALIYDGYIHNPDGTNEFKFNSPIVKLWWLKFIC